MTDYETLGKYQIQSELGKGGFATVYRAVDTTLDREVALKVLDPLLLRDGAWVARFRQEARSAANLRHPHIVGIHEIGEVEGRLYIAMELARGGSLAQAIVARGRIPWVETLSLLEPICEALDYAHGQGVIHRDLKPANILLDPEAGPLLTDFGFARLLSDNSMSVSLSGGILGTPAYIAPEIWELDRAERPADIYALGCIVYEMLVGEPLFSGKTPMQSMRAHDKGPQYPAAWPEDVPTGVATVLAKALAREPEKRYATARTLWHALHDLEAQAEVARAAVERAAVAAQWHAEAEAALAAGELSAAKMAVGRWLAATPEDARAKAMQADIALRIAEAERPAAPPMDAQEKPYAPPVYAPDLPAPAQPEKAVQVEVAQEHDVQGPAPATVPLAMPTKAKPSRRIPVLVWIAGGGMLMLCLLASCLLTGGFGLFRNKGGATVAAPTKTAPATLATPISTATETYVEIAPPTATPEPLPTTVIVRENVTRLTQVARWGKGWISDVAYSPDGTLLAVASAVGVHLYDAETLTEIRFIETQHYATSAAFTANGAILASGEYNGSIHLWRVSDGGLLKTLEGHTMPVLSVAFSPDGSLLASGGLDESICLWRVNDWTLLHTLQGHTDGVSSVAFSPDSSLLVSGGYDAIIRLWRMNDATLLRVLEGHTDDVNDVAFAPDGSMLASGSFDATARVWRVNDGALLHTLEGHQNWVTNISFDPEGNTLVSGGFDGNLRLWRVNDGKLLRTYKSHTDAIRAVTFSPDNVTLASGSTDGTVRIWRAVDGTLIHTLSGYTGAGQVLFAPDGSKLVSSASRTVWMWQMSNRSLRHTLTGHTYYVWDIAFAPDSATLASASGDGTIRLWHTNDATLYRTLNSPAMSVAFSSDGRTVASSGFDNEIQLWREGEIVHTLTGHTGDVDSVSFSPDGNLLASGGRDGTVRIWQASNGNLLHVLEGDGRQMDSVTFSADGSMLAAGGGDVWLWQTSDWRLLRTLKGDQWISDIDFSPDGRLLTSAYWDGEVRLWQTSDGKLVHKLQATGSSVAFAPEGDLLAIGLDDGTVSLWGIPEP